MIAPYLLKFRIILKKTRMQSIAYSNQPNFFVYYSILVLYVSSYLTVFVKKKTFPGALRRGMCVI